MKSDTHAVTLKIPDELYARLKAQAARQYNRPVCNLILSLLGNSLDLDPPPEGEKPGWRTIRDATPTNVALERHEVAKRMKRK